jgi:hypothetical protein
MNGTSVLTAGADRGRRICMGRHLLSEFEKVVASFKLGAGKS